MGIFSALFAVDLTGNDPEDWWSILVLFLERGYFAILAIDGSVLPQGAIPSKKPSYPLQQQLQHNLATTCSYYYRRSHTFPQPQHWGNDPTLRRLPVFGDVYDQHSIVTELDRQHVVCQNILLALAFCCIDWLDLLAVPLSTP